MSENTSAKKDEAQPERHKKITPRQWETIAEEAIRDAIERGEFENLPGQGRPLDLRRDPNVPPEWELAFKLLKDNGFAPDWIELDVEIRKELDKLFAPLERYLERAREFKGDRALREARLIADFRQHAIEVNRTIDIFNLKAPSPRVHRPRVRIEEQVTRFREACAKVS